MKKLIIPTYIFMAIAIAIISIQFIFSLSGIMVMALIAVFTIVTFFVNLSIVLIIELTNELKVWYK